MSIWKTEKVDFFGGWVVMKSYGPNDRLWLFPETTYGVLDSAYVKAHSTQKRAENALEKIRASETAPTAP